MLGAFTDASVAGVLLPEHTQEAPLAAHVEHISAAAIGEGGGPCFIAIEQNGDNQGAIHVDLGSYADAMFAKKEKVDLIGGTWQKQPWQCEV